MWQPSELPPRNRGAAQICLDLPETGPGSPDWWAEAPPASAPAKDRRAAWWCHHSRGAHWLSCPGSLQPASSHLLLQSVGPSVARCPHSPSPPSQLPTESQKGWDPQEKGLHKDAPPHQVAKQATFRRATQDLPAYLLVLCRRRRKRSSKAQRSSALLAWGRLSPGHPTRPSRRARSCAKTQAHRWLTQCRFCRHSALPDTPLWDRNGPAHFPEQEATALGVGEGEARHPTPSKK